ncbi:MAG: hypothetical protein QOI42_989 [Frankiaceae bacterium]|jgi:hypothetical protein|nr:hypothetical protein [Frankiaceae bacterium]
MTDTPGSAEHRRAERRRLIDLTRREKGLPERRALGTDRRSAAQKAAEARPTEGDRSDDVLNDDGDADDGDADHAGDADDSDDPPTSTGRPAG